MVINLDKATSLKLISTQEGCSPAFEPVNRIQSVASPTQSGKSSGSFFKFRRSISMVERRTIPASPDHNKHASALLDFTSPVSRNTFKRPAIPPSPDEEIAAKKSRHEDPDSNGGLRLTKSLSNVLSR